MAIRGHVFWVSGKPTRDSILLYNNVGVITKGSEDTASERLKLAVSETPLSFDAPFPENPANIRINLTGHCQKLKSLGYILPLTVWVCLFSFTFSWWTSKTHRPNILKQMRNGRSGSSKVVDFGQSKARIRLRISNTTLVLFCTVLGI